MTTNRIHTAAVIGLGFMGLRHVAAYGRAGLQVVAGADVREETRSELQKAVPPARFYADWRELLEKERPDIVSVVTHGPSHAEIVIAAAEQKVPAILCEKPLATSVADADRMVAACSRSGSRLFVNFSLRLFPSYQKIRDLIASGELGRIVHITASIGGARGLGCVGSHYADLMRFLSGDEPRRVWGALDATGTPNRRGPQFTDPGGYGVFAFAGGMRGFLEMSEDFSLPPTVTILCEYGKVEIDPALRRWDAYRYTGTGPLASKEVSGDARFIPVPLDITADIDLVEATARAIEAIRTGAPMATGEDGRQALELIFGIHVSHARGGATVPLPLKEADRSLNIPIT